jgi:hypothetical protein
MVSSTPPSGNQRHSHDHYHAWRQFRTPPWAGFSGGGTRASAFAFGVLREPAAPKSPAKGAFAAHRTGDLVSSVSGGSVTAAYCAEGQRHG